MVSSVHDSMNLLAQYNNSPFPIISLYLSVPEKNVNQHLSKKFLELIMLILSKKQLKTLHEDIDYIRAYLAQYRNTHNYRGLAIFSGDNKVWEVINTQFKLPDTLIVAHSPDLEPLEQNLSHYYRYLVVLADRAKARFFTLYRGKIEDEKTIKDPSVPQKVRANEERYYGRSDKIARHIEDHLHKHMQLIAEKIKEFVKDKPINGVIIGGHTTLIHKTEQYLPNGLKKKVIAHFISELNISLTEIAAQSLKIIQQTNNYTFQSR